MTFRIVYTKTSVKDIKKLDRVARRRIGKKIEILARDPLKNAKRLTDKKIGSYRWRIGNYRIIFDTDRKNIIILKIGHRREIYK